MSGRWSGLDWSFDVGTMIPLHKSGQSSTYKFDVSITLREKYVKKNFSKAKNFFNAKNKHKKAAK